MIRSLTVVAASFALAMAGPVLAGESAKAALTSVNGAVSVSQDGKISPARPGSLRAGDRVIARDGEAKLSYADGCVVTLKPQSMTTIGAASPCAAGGGLVSAGGAPAQMFGEMTAFQGVMAALAIGGFIAGVGSMVDNASNDDDDRRPVSP